MFNFITRTIAICMVLQGSVFAETGRYVRLELPGSGRTLHIAEIKVFSGQTNLAQQRSATQSSTLGTAVAAKAVDGNIDGNYAKGSVIHTSGGETVWWEVDLGTNSNVDRIEIYNRSDCCMDRINPGVLRLYDANKNLKWEEAITEPKASYTFTVPATNNLATTTKSTNLLLNADFAQITNNPLPDYWDLHHAAALKFSDLYNQYGIDKTQTSPTKGTNVLKIVNSEANFVNAILMPRKFTTRLSANTYVFSFYAKASANNAKIVVLPWWPADQLKKTISLTTAWKRYSVTMSQTQTGEVLQPILQMVNKATYQLSAPQLELGKTATAFNIANTDGGNTSIFNTVLRLAKNFGNTSDKTNTTNLINTGVNALAVPLTAAFEYSLYSTESNAVLQLIARSTELSTVSMRCPNAPSLSIPAGVMLQPGIPQSISLPLAGVPDGRIVCNFFQGNSSTPVFASAAFNKLPQNTNSVRVNNLKGYFEVDAQPFRIIGMGGIGTWDIPDLWYFQDLKAHGINTVFMTRQPANGKNYTYADVDKLLKNAGDAGLKVILGFAAAGAKPANLSSRMVAYTKLVEKYRENPNVLGWYPLDEPAANSWSDAEVQDLTGRVRALDPYRPVFVNWAYDGVPVRVGLQPRGNLSSTDVFSFDYYPFAGSERSLAKYLDYAGRTGLNALAYGLPSHSWLQLYGANDAWREPTGDELEYMAHVSLIFNQMFSYWDTKSNSKTTWERVTGINSKAQTISKLIASRDSQQILSPTVLNQFVYTAWKVNGEIYLLVANNENQAATFNIDMAQLTGIANPVVQNIYEGNAVNLKGSILQDDFAAYKCKVYKIVI